MSTMPWSLLVLPLVGAGIGWFTNYVAVRMLFRPRRPVRLLGFPIQGLIPRRRDDLAHVVGEVVERELLAGNDVSEALESDEFKERLSDVLDERIGEFLRRKVAERPLAGKFLTEDVLSPIRRGLLREVMNAFPAAARVLSHALNEHLDIGEMVEAKVRDLDLDDLEALVYRVAAEEFRHIEILGGVIGFLVGVAQLLLVALSG